MVGPTGGDLFVVYLSMSLIAFCLLHIHEV
jgi:hypothetical protein